MHNRLCHRWSLARRPVERRSRTARRPPVVLAVWSIIRSAADPGTRSRTDRLRTRDAGRPCGGDLWRLRNPSRRRHRATITQVPSHVEVVSAPSITRVDPGVSRNVGIQAGCFLRPPGCWRCRRPSRRGWRPAGPRCAQRRSLSRLATLCWQLRGAEDDLVRDELRSWLLSRKLI